MRVLYICHRFPYPPNRGGKIRPFNMIRHLHDQHEVTVASLVRSQEEAEDGRELGNHCHEYLMHRVGPTAAGTRMVANLPTSRPSSMGYFYSPSLARDISRTLSARRFDLIFVHCSSVAQYVEDVNGIPKILDFGDMDSQKWLDFGTTKSFPLSLGYLTEGLKLQLAERRLARKFDLCTCTTEAEWRTLEGYLTGTETDWFPNGVDSERFHPGGDAYDPDTICFIGRMDYYPNQESMLTFCQETLPRIQSHRPATKLLIVGAKPPRSIRRLGELPGVTVTGTVPQVQPFVQKSALMVAPLKIARGTQNKILEAMAMGVPTVCSTLAARGVDAVPGDHLVAADGSREFADRVLEILNNVDLRQRLAQSGRERILTHHSWPASMRKLDGIIERLLGRRAQEAARIESH